MLRLGLSSVTPDVIYNYYNVTVQLLEITVFLFLFSNSCQSRNVITSLSCCKEIKPFICRIMRETYHITNT